MMICALVKSDHFSSDCNLVSGSDWILKIKLKEYFEFGSFFLVGLIKLLKSGPALVRATGGDDVRLGKGQMIQPK